MKKLPPEGEKAIQLKPEFGLAYYNAAVHHAYLGRMVKAERVLSLAEARKIDVEENLMLAHNLAFWKGDGGAMERIAAHVRTTPAPKSWITHKEAFVQAYSGHLRAARDKSRTGSC